MKSDLCALRKINGAILPGFLYLMFHPHTKSIFSRNPHLPAIVERAQKRLIFHHRAKNQMLVSRAEGKGLLMVHCEFRKGSNLPQQQSTMFIDTTDFLSLEDCEQHRYPCYKYPLFNLPFARWRIFVTQLWIFMGVVMNFLHGLQLAFLLHFILFTWDSLKKRLVCTFALCSAVCSRCNLGTCWVGPTSVELLDSNSGRGQLTQFHFSTVPEQLMAYSTIGLTPP